MYRLGPSHEVPKDLPDGWEAKQLGQLVQVVQGGRLGLTKEKDYVSWGVPAFSAAGQDGFVEKAEFRNQAGVVLSAIGANCGRCFYAEGDWTTLANVQALLPNGELNARVLYYRTNVENYWERSGSAQPFIKPSSIKKAWIAYPSAQSQQRRIAEILSAVDEAIEQTEALIAKTQQIKAGLMHDLFTRGVTADGRLRPPREEAPQLYKESPLGWMPKEWSTVLLDDIAIRGSGHTPNKNHPEYWNGTIKWVSLADSWRLDRVHISDTDHYITQAGIENSSAVLHPAGIVVLSRDAGVGKSAVTTSEMAVSQHFMCWRCGPRLHNYYLYYWLQHRKWEFENIATGSTIPTIGLRFFRHYRINVPVQVAEQSKIAATVLAAEEQAFALEEDLRKLRCLRVGLMHDLLTGRVPVSAESAPAPKEVAANV